MTTRSSYSARARVHPSTLQGARRVGYLLSILLVCASLTMAIPLAISAGYGESATVGDFATTLLIGVVIGAAGFFFLRSDLGGLTRREGFAAVALGWLMVCLIGSVPFMLAGGLDPINAWFETVSGFTGTGSSVIADVEALPRGLLFWRSFTHWLGGMGFVALYIAIFPLMGVGAMQLFRAEAPGLEMDRLRPRIKSTAQHPLAHLPRHVGHPHDPAHGRRNELVRRRLPDVRRHRHRRVLDQEQQHRGLP